MNFARENASLILCTNEGKGIDLLCPLRYLKASQIIKSVFGMFKDNFCLEIILSRSRFNQVYCHTRGMVAHGQLPEPEAHV